MAAGHDNLPSHRLFNVVADLESAVTRLPTSPGPDDARNRLFQLIRIVQAIRERVPPSLLSVRDLDLALVDAEEILRITAASVAGEGSRVDLAQTLPHVDGLLRRLAWLIAVAALPMEREPSRQLQGSQDSFAAITEAYREEGVREHTWMIGMHVIAIALLVIALTATFLGTRQGIRYHYGAHNSFNFPMFTPYAIMATIAFVGALVTLGLARRHGSFSQEANRIAWQLVGTGQYLASMPEGPRTIEQAALVQRLFPRLLQDDDPLREPVWPTTDQVLAAMERSSMSSE